MLKCIHFLDMKTNSILRVYGEDLSEEVIVRYTELLECKLINEKKENTE